METTPSRSNLGRYLKHVHNRLCMFQAKPHAATQPYHSATLRTTSASSFAPLCQQSSRTRLLDLNRYLPTSVWASPRERARANVEKPPCSANGAGLANDRMSLPDCCPLLLINSGELRLDSLLRMSVHKAAMAPRHVGRKLQQRKYEAQALPDWGSVWAARSCKDSRTACIP